MDSVAETWRRTWGTENFFTDPIFLDDIFSGKFPFFTSKISDDFFSLVIDQVFLIFRIFTVLNVVYHPLFTRKSTMSEKNSFMTHFLYSFRTFARIRQHYFSKYWGDGCMGRPPTPIFWGPSPQSP